MKSFGKKAEGERRERMKASPQWRDDSFVNVDYQPSAAPQESMPLREFLCPTERRKPRESLPSADPRPRWLERPDTGIRVTWLGHSTALLEIDGSTILTDPVWGDRASPSRLVGPRRFQPPVVPIETLPAVDAVLLSHDHYDHLDFPTIQALAATGVPFVASLGLGAHLEAWGVDPARITELDWWEACQVPSTEVRVTATPAQHFSGRKPGDRNPTLWSSFVVESAAGKVFFGGDSGLMPGFRTIGKQFGPFDLVMLEIGAYHPAWGDIHLGPENALVALDHLGGGPMLPIHWGTFDLSTHRWDQPIEVVLRDSAATGIQLLTPRLGEPVEPAAAPDPRPWWRAVSTLDEPTHELLDASEVPTRLD